MQLTQAADALIATHFAVAPGETVLVTVDTGTEQALIDALFDAVIRAGGRPMIVLIAQLPFQGALADPYLPPALSAAVEVADVWLDFCFPYMAGSKMHDKAMKAGKTRYALLAMAGADCFARLYGSLDFTAMMEFQIALANYVGSKAGSVARFTCPRGTDITFTMAELKLKRHRVANVPGMHTVPGAQNLYPVLESVKGQIVLQALFDEIYRTLRQPITLQVDGRIQSFSGAAAEDQPRLERALRRASGSGGQHYGYCIHFTLGFHPGTQLTGKHFIEDIRIPGSNAIGMGLPWWEAGGGENHPDGVVFDQSLWIDGEQVLDCGRLVGPPALVVAYQPVQPRFA
jgi:leucyl aminopeptidase (aminopeptidase T)